MDATGRHILKIQGYRSEGMSEKIITAEEIFSMIDNQSINRETGIKLIENYGLRKQREAVESLQKEFGGYSSEIETTITRITAQLDEMLKNTIGVKN
jgi:hypothetical protein